MFIKLERSDSTQMLININSIDSVVYHGTNTCILYTNKCQFTINISYARFVEKLIKLNVEVD